VNAAAERFSQMMLELARLIESEHAEHCQMAVTRALQEAADDVVRMNP